MAVVSRRVYGNVYRSSVEKYIYHLINTFDNQFFLNGTDVNTFVNAANQKLTVIDKTGKKLSTRQDDMSAQDLEYYALTYGKLHLSDGRTGSKQKLHDAILRELCKNKEINALINGTASTVPNFEDAENGRFDSVFSAIDDIFFTKTKLGRDHDYYDINEERIKAVRAAEEDRLKELEESASTEDQTFIDRQIEDIKTMRDQRAERRAAWQNVRNNIVESIRDAANKRYLFISPFDYAYSEKPITRKGYGCYYRTNKHYCYALGRDRCDVFAVLTNINDKANLFAPVINQPEQIFSSNQACIPFADNYWAFDHKIGEVNDWLETTPGNSLYRFPYGDGNNLQGVEYDQQCEENLIPALTYNIDSILEFMSPYADRMTIDSSFDYNGFRRSMGRKSKPGDLDHQRLSQAALSYQAKARTVRGVIAQGILNMREILSDRESRKYWEEKAGRNIDATSVVIEDHLRYVREAIRMLNEHNIDFSIGLSSNGQSVVANFGRNQQLVLFDGFDGSRQGSVTLDSKNNNCIVLAHVGSEVDEIRDAANKTKMSEVTLYNKLHAAAFKRLTTDDKLKALQYFLGDLSDKMPEQRPMYGNRERVVVKLGNDIQLQIEGQDTRSDDVKMAMYNRSVGQLYGVDAAQDNIYNTLVNSYMSPFFASYINCDFSEIQERYKKDGEKDGKKYKKGDLVYENGKPKTRRGIFATEGNRAAKFGELRRRLKAILELSDKAQTDADREKAAQEHHNLMCEFELFFGNRIDHGVDAKGRHVDMPYIEELYTALSQSERNRESLLNYIEKKEEINDKEWLDKCRESINIVGFNTLKDIPISLHSEDVQARYETYMHMCLSSMLSDHINAAKANYRNSSNICGLIDFIKSSMPITEFDPDKFDENAADEYRNEYNYKNDDARIADAQKKYVAYLFDADHEFSLSAEEKARLDPNDELFVKYVAFAERMKHVYPANDASNMIEWTNALYARVLFKTSTNELSQIDKVLTKMEDRNRFSSGNNAEDTFADMVADCIRSASIEDIINGTCFNKSSLPDVYKERLGSYATRIDGFDIETISEPIRKAYSRAFMIAREFDNETDSLFGYAPRIKMPTNYGIENAAFGRIPRRSDILTEKANNSTRGQLLEGVTAYNTWVDEYNKNAGFNVELVKDYDTSSSLASPFDREYWIGAVLNSLGNDYNESYIKGSSYTANNMRNNLVKYDSTSEQRFSMTLTDGQDFESELAKALKDKGLSSDSFTAHVLRSTYTSLSEVGAVRPIILSVDDKGYLKYECIQYNSDKINLKPEERKKIIDNKYVIPYSGQNADFRITAGQLGPIIEPDEHGAYRIESLGKVYIPGIEAYVVPDDHTDNSVTVRDRLRFSTVDTRMNDAIRSIIFNRFATRDHEGSPFYDRNNLLKVYTKNDITTAYTIKDYENHLIENDDEPNKTQYANYGEREKGFFETKLIHLGKRVRFPSEYIEGATTRVQSGKNNADRKTAPNNNGRDIDALVNGENLRSMSRAFDNILCPESTAGARVQGIVRYFAAGVKLTRDGKLCYDTDTWGVRNFDPRNLPDGVNFTNVTMSYYDAGTETWLTAEIADYREYLKNNAGTLPDKFMLTDGTVEYDKAIFDPSDPDNFSYNYEILNPSTDVMFKTDAFKYVSHNPADREVMVCNQIIDAERLTTARVAFCTMFGYNFDDAMVISKEYADRCNILDHDGNPRSQMIHDKASDMNGNKGVVGLVVDRYDYLGHITGILDENIPQEVKDSLDFDINELNKYAKFEVIDGKCIFTYVGDPHKKNEDGSYADMRTIELSKEEYNDYAKKFELQQFDLGAIEFTNRGLQGNLFKAYDAESVAAIKSIFARAYHEQNARIDNRCCRVFYWNPDLEIVVSPYSSMSRFNAGSLESGLNTENKGDLYLPDDKADNGYVLVKSAIVNVDMMSIGKMSADDKTHVYADELTDKEYIAAHKREFMAQYNMTEEEYAEFYRLSKEEYIAKYDIKEETYNKFIPNRYADKSINLQEDEHDEPISDRNAGEREEDLSFDADDVNEDGSASIEDDRTDDEYEDDSADEKKAHTSRGRKFGAQTIWAFNQVKSAAMLNFIFKDNIKSWNDLREHLIAIGYDMDTEGKIVQGYTPNEAVNERRRLYTMKDIMREVDEELEKLKQKGRNKFTTTGDFSKSAKDAIKNISLKLISESGGFLELPFGDEMSYGVDKLEATARKYSVYRTGANGKPEKHSIIPMLPASLRSGIKQDDDSVKIHEYNRHYQTIVSNMIMYELYKREKELTGDKEAHDKTLNKYKGAIKSKFKTISRDVYEKQFHEKANDIRENVDVSYVKNSGTFPIAGDARLPIGCARLSLETALRLGIYRVDSDGKPCPADELDAKGEHILNKDGYPIKGQPRMLSWRDPIVHKECVQVFDVIIDESSPAMLGITINPGIDSKMDADFDGDTMAVFNATTNRSFDKKLPANVAEELYEKFGPATTMLNPFEAVGSVKNKDSYDPDPNDPDPYNGFSKHTDLFINYGMDIKSNVYYERTNGEESLAEKYDDLTKRANFFSNLREYIDAAENDDDRNERIEKIIKQATKDGKMIHVPGDVGIDKPRHIAMRNGVFVTRGKSEDYPVDVINKKEMRDKYINDWIEGNLRRVYNELNAFVHESFDRVGAAALSFESENTLVESINSIIHSKAKGDAKKGRKALQNAGINVDVVTDEKSGDAIVKINDEKPTVTHDPEAARNEKIDIYTASAMKSDFTSAGGMIAQRFVTLMRLEDQIDDALTGSYPGTQAILGIKHDPERGSIIDSVMQVCLEYTLQGYKLWPDDWSKYSTDELLSQVHLPQVECVREIYESNGEYKTRDFVQNVMASEDDLKKQFEGIYRMMGINCNKDTIDNIAKLMCSDGKARSIEEASRDYGSLHDILSYKKLDFFVKSLENVLYDKKAEKEAENANKKAPPKRASHGDERLKEKSLMGNAFKTNEFIQVYGFVAAYASEKIHNIDKQIQEGSGKDNKSLSLQRNYYDKIVKAMRDAIDRHRGDIDNVAALVPDKITDSDFAIKMRTRYKTEYPECIKDKRFIDYQKVFREAMDKGFDQGYCIKNPTAIGARDSFMKPDDIKHEAFIPDENGVHIGDDKDSVKAERNFAERNTQYVTGKDMASCYQVTSKIHEGVYEAFVDPDNIPTDQQVGDRNPVEQFNNMTLNIEAEKTHNGNNEHGGHGGKG